MVIPERHLLGWGARPDGTGAGRGGENDGVMRRLVGAVLVLAAITVACSEEAKPTANRAFCTAADNYNNELVRGQKKGKADLDRQIPLVEKLVQTAPKKIKADADAFLAAMRRLRTDPSVKGDPAVQKVVDNVNRFANQACNVYQRDSGI
jgi:hypothetical protein